MTEPKEQVSSSQPKRDKFASMAASLATASSSPRPAPQQEELQAGVAISEEKKELLKQRMEQRDKVLKDLQKAEGWTWNLLTLAKKTADSLSKLDTTKEQVSQLSKQYRDTLQNINSVLTPHASLVVAYQNHSIDRNGKEDSEGKEERHEQKESVNMYAAKVERKLAQERRNVLQELLRLEQQGGDTIEVKDKAIASKASTGKRKR